MFGNIGWDKQFDLSHLDDISVILGLKAIMVIFPSIALVIGLIFLFFYFFIPNISLASSTVATSLPISLAILTILFTS